MIQFQFFPRSQGITKQMEAVIDCFQKVNSKIKSPENNLTSNEVLEIISTDLKNIGFRVEQGKSKEKKISVPVLFGLDNVIDKSFNADAVGKDVYGKPD